MANDNFSISYFDTCGSHVMLLLHGYTLNNGMWAPQYSDLYDLARMIAPDFPGHGTSDILDEEYPIALLARQCLDLLDSLGITQPVVLCGLSMGGLVAFELMRQAPERVKGLILTSTQPTADSYATRTLRESQITQIRHGRYDRLMDDALPRYFSPVTLDENGDLVEFVRELVASTTPEGAIGALRAMKERPNSTGLLPKIDIPTLVIHGEDDLIVSVQEAETMAAAIPTAELHILPDAGHLPNLEQPEIFNDIVAAFLEELG